MANPRTPAGAKNTHLLSVCSSTHLIADQIPLKIIKMMKSTISAPPADIAITR